MICCFILELPTVTEALWDKLSTHRHVAYLQSSEPAQLFQDSEEDFSLMRRKSLHRLPQHRRHVAERARRPEHDA